MTGYRINIDERNNDTCRLCKNKSEREGHIISDLCRTAKSLIDKQPVRCVGPWSYDKVYRLVQYFGIFTIGMHNKWKINYIEICSGPGRCISRDNGKELDGTALAVLKHSAFRYINSALFVDYNQEAVDILNHRIQSLGLENQAKAICIDYTDKSSLDRELSLLGGKALTLALVDPTDCGVPFSLIEFISTKLYQVDFIINFAAGTDIRRNIHDAVLKKSFHKVREKYSKFLGDERFLESNEIYNIAKKQSLAVLMNRVMLCYENSWKNIGYQYLSSKPVKHYYYLFFASKSSKGLEFWSKANTYEPDGQLTFRNLNGD